MKQLEFFVDCARRTGAELGYRPLLLGGVMADPAALRDLIAVAALDPAPLLAAGASEPIKDAPSFFVDGEIFFGDDLRDFVEEALRA